MCFMHFTQSTHSSHQEPFKRRVTVSNYLKKISLYVRTQGETLYSCMPLFYCAVHALYDGTPNYTYLILSS